MKKFLVILFCVTITVQANQNPLLSLLDDEFIELFSIHASDYQNCIDFWAELNSRNHKKREAQCETMRTNIYFLITGFKRSTKKAIFSGGMDLFKDKSVQKRFVKRIPKNDRFSEANYDAVYEEHF